MEPRRKEWAAACHGVGRKPGDGRPRLQCVAVAFRLRAYALRRDWLAPSRSARGSDCFLWLAGVPSLRDSTPAYALTSLRNSKFRSPLARHRFDNCRYVDDCLVMPTHHLLRGPANLKQPPFSLRKSEKMENEATNSRNSGVWHSRISGIGWALLPFLRVSPCGAE